jgi:hypothetical protein
MWWRTAVGCGVLLLAAGAAAEKSARHADRARPRPGRLIDVDGYRMNTRSALYAMGGARSASPCKASRPDAPLSNF